MNKDNLIRRYIDGLTSPDEERQLREQLEAETYLTEEERAVLDLMRLSFPEEDTDALIVEDLSAEFEAIQQASKPAAVRFSYRRIITIMSAAAAIIVAFILWQPAPQQPKSSIYPIPEQNSPARHFAALDRSRTSSPSEGRDTQSSQEPDAPQEETFSPHLGGDGGGLTAASAKPDTTSDRAAIEDLNYYIARLETEMENLDDSVSTAHLEQLIAADARLQMLVNRIVHVQVEQAMNDIQKDSTANYINF